MKNNKPKFDIKMEVRQIVEVIEQTLESFGITAKVSEVNMLDDEVEFRLEVALVGHLVGHLVAVAVVLLAVAEEEAVEDSL